MLSKASAKFATSLVFQDTMLGILSLFKDTLQLVMESSSSSDSQAIVVFFYSVGLFIKFRV